VAGGSRESEVVVRILGERGPSTVVEVIGRIEVSDQNARVEDDQRHSSRSRSRCVTWFFALRRV
jgi:hypothetical protein